MGTEKNSKNKLAAQIAAEDAEEDQFVVPIPANVKEHEDTAAAKREKKTDAAKKKETAAPLYTAEQVQQMMKEAAAAAVAEAMKNLPQQPQVVQVMADTEKVVLRWMAPVADDNVAVFGANGMYGQVTGKNGTVIVPKGEWSRFYDETMRRFIDRRWLVVLSGMTDEERMLYHCDYRKARSWTRRDLPISSAWARSCCPTSTRFAPSTRRWWRGAFARRRKRASWTAIGVRW